MLKPTEHGLFCEAGGFYVDPWKPVERAVVTHGHSDHAHAGCASYLCSRTCGPILRTRLGQGISLETLAFGERRRIGDATVSLHPAGHVLGSAQVRIEHGGQVWVASGDYKTQPDPAAEPFEPVACHTFITESTFGLPIYRWPDPAAVFAQINAWWARNAEEATTSVVFAYSLGKAQRVLMGLDPSIGPIIVHAAVAAMAPCYEAAGLALPRSEAANLAEARRLRGRAIVIAPPGADTPGWLRRFGRVSTALASGWMSVRGARRRLAHDRGFVLSDHADWPGLLGAIDATGAARVGVTHGSTRALARWLRERGRDAFEVPTRYQGEAAEEREAAGGTGEGN